MKMTNEKGFTLVEILVSIGLVVLIGTSVTVLIMNKRTNEEELFKKIVKSALVYISTEKDEAGNTYENGINKGGEGVIIPLKELYDTGYLEEKDYSELVLLIPDDEEYVIAGYKGAEECETGGITITAGWVDKTTYICGFNSSGSGSLSPNDLYNTIKKLPSSSDCKENSTSLCLLHGTSENAIADPNKDGTYDDIYYFKGRAENNYLKISGLEDTFRIVRTTENQNIKIVDDDNNLIQSNLYSNGSPFSSFCKTFYGADNQFDCSYNTPSGEYPHITMSGYKITEYRAGRWDSDKYYCDVEDNISSWSDDKMVSCSNSSGSVKTTQSPIYLTIYRPLLERYDSISSVLENYIDAEYKWCMADVSSSDISSISFKCKEEKTLASKFGLLSIFEYKNVQKIESISRDEHQYFYSKDLGTWPCGTPMEITFGSESESENIFSHTYRLHPNYGWCSVSDNMYLRTTYVIKGNSKVISGDGSEDNPFIIDGFVS